MPVGRRKVSFGGRFVGGAFERAPASSHLGRMTTVIPKHQERHLSQSPLLYLSKFPPPEPSLRRRHRVVLSTSPGRAAPTAGPALL